jgi:DNA repair protein RadC
MNGRQRRRLPERIIDSALSRNAAEIILVHNHPSGNPVPSREDKVLTGDITEATATLDIRVLDHIILGKEGYFSFMGKRFGASCKGVTGYHNVTSPPALLGFVSG